MMDGSPKFRKASLDLVRSIPQRYLPVMLNLYGALPTVELSILRYDEEHLYLTKPDGPQPTETGWKCTPLRWSVEREPFCILTHAATGRLRLVVAKPNAPCEQWPAMFIHDLPEFAPGCSVHPSQCDLTPFMWNGGMYVACLRNGPFEASVNSDSSSNAGGSASDRSKCYLAVFQIQVPNQPWTLVGDFGSCVDIFGSRSSGSHSGGCSTESSSRVKISCFYYRSSETPLDRVGNKLEVYMCVQNAGLNTSKIFHVGSPSEKWNEVADMSRLLPSTCSPTFAQCTPPASSTLTLPGIPGSVISGSSASASGSAASVTGTGPVAKTMETYCLWVEGCLMRLAYMRRVGEWQHVISVSVPPMTAIAPIYTPMLSEPLIISTSMDASYVGSAAVWRLFFLERLLRPDLEHEIPFVSPIRFLQIPNVPCAPVSLAMDLPVTELPFQEPLASFLGVKLPYDLPASLAQTAKGEAPLVGSELARFSSDSTTGPAVTPILVSCGKDSFMVDLDCEGLQFLVPSIGDSKKKDAKSTEGHNGDAATAEEANPTINDGTSSQAGLSITPVRWSQQRNVMFCLVQDAASGVSKVVAANSGVPMHLWAIQREIPDSEIQQLSRSKCIPFQMQGQPGVFELFMLVFDEDGYLGPAVYYIATPTSQWEFVRCLDATHEAPFIAAKFGVKPLYHRVIEAGSTTVATSFIVPPVGGSSIQSMGAAPYWSVFTMTDPAEPLVLTRRLVLPGVSPTLTGMGHNFSAAMPIYSFIPKPPVRHVWPCETFLLTRLGNPDDSDTSSSRIAVYWVSDVLLPARFLFSFLIPSGAEVVPLYLPYSTEPLILVHNPANQHAVDVIRLNLLEAVTFMSLPVCGGVDLSQKCAKFVARMELEDIPRELSIAVPDLTLDTPLLWLPQQGANGSESFYRNPMPFESDRVTQMASSA